MSDADNYSSTCVRRHVLVRYLFIPPFLYSFLSEATAEWVPFSHRIVPVTGNTLQAVIFSTRVRLSSTPAAIFWCVFALPRRPPIRDQINQIH